MRLTLFADASLCPQTGIAGWGAWAKRDGWRSGRIFGSTFRNRYHQSHDAEMAAIANALYVLCQSGDLDDAAEVYIQSDSLRSLAIIAEYVPKATVNDHVNGANVRKITSAITEAEKSALNVIADIASAKHLVLVVRHVKGHQKGGQRSWVNRQCDREAKKHMRSARIQRRNGVGT